MQGYDPSVSTSVQSAVDSMTNPALPQNQPVRPLPVVAVTAVAQPRLTMTISEPVPVTGVAPAPTAIPLLAFALLIVIILTFISSEVARGISSDRRRDAGRS